VELEELGERCYPDPGWVVPDDADDPVPEWVDAYEY